MTASPGMAARPAMAPIVWSWSLTDSAAASMGGRRSLGGRAYGRTGRARAQSRELGDLPCQPRRVALQHEQPDLVEHVVDRLGVGPLALGAQDALGPRLDPPFVGVEQLLVELLPRPPA